MVQVHIVLGLVTLIVAVALLIWNALRFARNDSSPSFRIVLVGLLDLQVLLGIIAIIIAQKWGAWLLHPVLMIGAVAVAHVMLKESRPKRTQLFGYVLVPVLLLLGAWVPNLL